MALKLSVAPTTEPITLAEAKLHLRVSSGSLDDNITVVQSISPGVHVVASGWSLIGATVDVLGYSSMVILESGTNGTGGTVDVKLQHSDDNITFTDVASGAFTQVTEANDNATYEKEYTGGKQYLKILATVAGDTCEFGVSIVKSSPDSEEDALITSLITTARRYCETFQNRVYITQTWEYWLDAFPCKGQIQIPLPPLQSISSIKYYDVDDNELTFADASYFQDTKNEPGWVILNYGESWPSTTLRSANGVCITFVAGYGIASAVPETVKQAMKLLIGHWYEHREEATDKPLTKVPTAVESLLWMERIF